MNAKNRLIERLLQSAKKHKILTYPVLAVVAIISFFGNLFNWRNGAGKRVVAIIMVMVMFVSQSYFLTSSATALVDTEEEALIQKELQEASVENEDEITTEASKEEPAEVSKEESAETTQELAEPATEAPNQDSSEEMSAPDTDAASTEDGEGTTTETANVTEEDEELDSKLESKTVECVFMFEDEGKPGGYTRIVGLDVSSNSNSYDVTKLMADEAYRAGIDGFSRPSEGGTYTFGSEWYYYDNKQQVTDLTNVRCTSETQIVIYCVRKITAYHVKISDEKEESSLWGDASFNGSTTYTTSCNKLSDDVIEIPVTSNTLVLTDISREGYKLAYVELDGVKTGSVSIGAKDVAVPITGSQAVHNVTLGWRPESYNLYYQISDTEQVSQTVYYDGIDTFLYRNDVIPKPGYEFKGDWQVHYGDADVEVKEGDSVTFFNSGANLLYTGPGCKVILTPVFKYINVILDREEIKFEYKTESDEEVIRIMYDSETNPNINGDNFEWTIDSASESALNDYGITVTKDARGYVLKPGDGGPTRSNSGHPLEVVFHITDTNAPADAAIEDCSVMVSIVPMQLRINKPDDRYTNKTYDRTTDTNLPNILTASNASGTVTVNVTYTSSAYDRADVDAGKIILQGVNWTAPAGEDSSNYVLVQTDTDGYSVPGRITPRKLYVEAIPIFTNGRDYVRAGEANPDYDVTIVDSGKSDEGLMEGDDQDWLDEISFLITKREDLEKEYRGGIDELPHIVDMDTSEAGLGRNYEVDMTLEAMQRSAFEVIMEDTVQNVNYWIDGIQEESTGWYIGDSISILPIEEKQYDTVLISRDGENGTFYQTSLSEADSNKDIWIRLRDSKTGAISRPAKLELRYDNSAPEYAGYTFTQRNEENELTYNSGDAIPNGGLYFPGIGGVMDFGTYTKSEIELKVKYTDTVSGVKTLYYGLFGTNPSVDDGSSVVFDKSTGYATIRVLADVARQVGTIKCFAVDEAGNRSTMIQLSPTGDQDNIYEWGVEQIAPQIDSFAIKYRVGTNNGDYHYETIYSSREWYNHCRAELKVSDATAGLHAINWYINDELADTTLYTSKVTTSDTVIKEIPATGSSDAYRVYAEILDNAGNSQKTQEYQLKIDDVMPVLTVYYDGNEYTQDNKIMFTVRDDLSGVNYVRVSHMVDGEMRTQNCDLGNPDEDGLYTASFNVDTKGVYVVTAVDHAGNVHEWSREINTISREVPDCPEITFAPAEPNGANGWYNTIPAVTIHNVKFTADQTPVTTKYQMWKDDDRPMMEATVTGDGETRDIPGDGIYHIKAWSRSASGVDCISSAGDEVQVKVDTIKPTVEFTTNKGSGASIIVDFTVTDTGSGVDTSTVRVMHGVKEIVAEVAEENGVCTGSFEITETGDYTISVADFAGNVTQTEAFTPMSMKVKAVKNITRNSAVLGANVYKGTFDIQNASIAYRKISDAAYTQAEALPVKDDNGNWSISTVLSSLSENTVYVYKVTAVSVGGEVLEYEGYFRTLSSNNEGITITGTARYATSREGAVTVGLFEGNVCIMATEINAGEEFSFSNVADGNYSIIATDGVYSKTMRLLIRDGVVIYPTKYIDLVLSGKNTSVVITSTETPHVTADNMDSIFDDDPVNYTTEDEALIQAGGTVEFRLYATLMSVSSVSANEISAMYAVTDGNKIVGAYLDLSLYKIITDADGKVERERVTELANGANVSVTIPLGDLAGKSGLEIVRIHDTGDAFVGASLKDMDNNPNTYTITTTQFSTYAVLYNPEESGDDDGPGNGGDNIVIPSEEGVSNLDSTDDNGQDDDSSPNGSSASVGTLKSSGSAKTGDAAPVAALGMLVFAGVAGFVTLRKKYK